MNLIDIAIFVILGLCAWGGFRRGLIRTVYRLVSFFVALFLAHQLYPHGAAFLRSTALFPAIRNSIARAMNFESVFNEHIVGVGLIDQLPLPDALRALLHANNTPDMFALLQVATVEEYIAGFFANIVVNAMALLAVFILVMIGLSIAGYALDIVAMLPVISTLNRAGGLALGLVMGMILVWVGVLVMTIFFATGTHPDMYDLMQGSVVTRWIFENEFLLHRLVAV